MNSQDVSNYFQDKTPITKLMENSKNYNKLQADPTVFIKKARDDQNPTVAKIQNRQFWDTGQQFFTKRAMSTLTNQVPDVFNKEQPCLEGFLRPNDYTRSPELLTELESSCDV